MQNLVWITVLSRIIQPGGQSGRNFGTGHRFWLWPTWPTNFAQSTKLHGIVPVARVEGGQGTVTKITRPGTRDWPNYSK